MLKIRLQRTGSKNNPTFRLVVAEKGRSAKGKVLEILGHYLPTRDPAEFVFKQDRVEYHIKNGAAPSDTVARLLTNAGMKGLEKFMERYTKQKKRKEVEEEEAAASAPAAEDAPAEDSPKEEAPAEAEEKKEEAPAEEEKKEEEPKEEKKEEEKPAEEEKEEPKEDAPAEEASDDDKKDADS